MGPRQCKLTIMNIADTCSTLEQQLSSEIARDPLQALSAIDQARRIIDLQQRQAVRAAVQHHSWAEIGEAMGVTKQAAHQKFARAWVDELKAEVKATSTIAKIARRQGDHERAATAKARVDDLIAEIKRGKPRT
jgi:hypothetical protein